MCSFNIILIHYHVIYLQYQCHTDKLLLILCFAISFILSASSYVQGQNENRLMKNKLKKQHIMWNINYLI